MSIPDHKKDWDWLVACRVAGQVERLPAGSLPLVRVIGGSEPCKYCHWTEQVGEDGSREGFDGAAITTIQSLWPGSTLHMTQALTSKSNPTPSRLLVFTAADGKRILLAPKRRSWDVGKPEVSA